MTRAVRSPHRAQPLVEAYLRMLSVRDTGHKPRVPGSPSMSGEPWDGVCCPVDVAGGRILREGCHALAGRVWPVLAESSGCPTVSP